jgi:hypothetical protein
MTYRLRGATDVCTSNALTLTADEPHSTPCRRCLTDADPGERVLLVSYDPFDVDSPYRSASPVFVHAEECTPYEGRDVPDQQRRRLLSVRAYDAAGLMVDAEVTEGTRLEAELERLFADARVDFVHVHNARPGCFAVRVERTEPVAQARG